MRWPFRRKRGRHDLGAAVTAIPSLVTVVPAPEPEPVPLPLQEPDPVAEPVREPEPSPASGPRVELGFRDGSSAALAPGSPQAKALTEIASLLTQRD